MNADFRNVPAPGHFSGSHWERSLRMAISGAWRFTLVSLVAFSVWAWGGAGFRHMGGEPVMYAAIALVFVVLSGALLHSLMGGVGSLYRFYRLFVPAFLAYAGLWSVCWFWLGPGRGEWLGAVLGGIAFVGLAAGSLRSWRGTALALAIAGFLLFHTLGYYSGGWSMYQLLAKVKSGELSWLGRTQGINLAKWSWGLGYGLGFGAGLGWVLGCLQPPGLAAGGEEFGPVSPGVITKKGG